jgi:hypothetical protein
MRRGAGVVATAAGNIAALNQHRAWRNGGGGGMAANGACAWRREHQRKMMAAQ